MKNKKKILSLIACLSLLSSCNRGTSSNSSCSITTSTPTSVEPTPEPDKNYDMFSTYTSSDNTLQISLKDEYRSTITELIIPEEIDGKKVTDIASTTLRNCPNLTYVFIPKTVKTFNFQTRPTTSLLDNSLKIQNIEIDKDNETFYTKGNLILSRDENSESSYVVAGWGDIEIPDEVESLGAYPFTNSNVKNIKLGKNLKTINYQTFRKIYIESIDLNGNTNFKFDNNVLYCDSQKSDYNYTILAAYKNIKIPSEITTLTVFEPNTFSSFYSITSIEIPDTLTSMTINSFINLPQIEDIHFESNSKRSDYQIEDGSNILLKTSDKSIITSWSKNAIIPSGVTKIGTSAFSNNLVLESLQIPASVNSIDAVAFRSCPALKTVTIDPSNITYSVYQNCLIVNKNSNCIDSSYGYNFITKITLPTHVRTIKPNSLNNFKLESFTFNEGYTTLNTAQFLSNGSSCKEINISSTITTIDPKSLQSIYGIERINLNNNKNFETKNGMLFNVDTKELIYAYGDVDVRELIDLTNYTFSYLNYNITSLTLSKNNTNIVKNETFDFLRYTNCIANSIYLPDMNENEFKNWKYFDCFVNTRINSPKSIKIVFSDNSSKTIKQLLDELK